jgi:hypothetical protein
MQRLTTAAVAVFTLTAVAACSTDTLTDPARGNNAIAKSIAPPPPTVTAPFFVIGDIEAHSVGDTVNFWGPDWWKNNSVSGLSSSGIASFKGYTNVTAPTCGGTWSALTGNSLTPPDTIPADVAIVVTGSTLKDGPSVSGNVEQILIVHQDGGYGPSVGHAGNGVVTRVVCP